MNPWVARTVVSVVVVFSLLMPLTSGATPIHRGAHVSSLRKAALVTSGRSNTVTSSAKTSTTPFPDGTPDRAEPSGEAPPRAAALPGYRESYVHQFTGSSLPGGWSAFTGAPEGDPGAQFGSAHVVVAGGVLQLNAWRDPAYGDEWVTGGVCQCQVASTYGAYFVRSKMTGAGATQVELLWPASGWPPEIDFDETYGAITSSMATLHYSSNNVEIHDSVNVDMTQWHTWGVIWTPTSITYTLDGQVWGTITDPSVIPDQPMTLDLQQQTWCASGYACPTAPESTDINWVAEYTATDAKTTSTTAAAAAKRTTPTTRTTIGPFAGNSTKLSTSLMRQVDAFAVVVKRDSDATVRLTGYSARRGSRTGAIEVSRARANAVASYLRHELTTMKVQAVTIVPLGESSTTLSPHSQSVVATAY